MHNLRYCIIQSCENHRGRPAGDGTRFFRAPKGDEMREAWLNEIRKHQCLADSASYSMKLCELHFEQRFLFKNTRNVFALKTDAVPTIFNGSIQNQIKVEENDPLETIPNPSLQSQLHENPIQPQIKFRCVNNECLKQNIELQKLQVQIVELKKSYYKLQYEVIRLTKLENKNQMPIQKFMSKATQTKCDENPSIHSSTDENEHICNGQQEISQRISDICDEKCSNVHQMQNHMNEMHKVKPKRSEQNKQFQCGSCGKCFRRWRMVLEHMIKRHELPGHLTRFECYVCGRKFQSLDETHNHLKDHIPCKRCSVCNKLCTPIQLETHMCDQLKAIDCVYCHQTFNSMKHLLKHLQECDKEKFRYQCTKCPKWFLMESLKDLHLKYYCEKNIVAPQLRNTERRNKANATKYLCDLCGKELTSARNLRWHRNSHGEKTVKCPHCDQKFTLELSLKMHIQRMHKNVTFACNTCGITLKCYSSMQKHKKLHTRTEADRKHACTLCKLKFFEKDTLRTHMKNVHFAAERFKCEYCDKTYKYKGDLTKHLREMHMGDDMYRCTECPKRFRLPWEFERHKFEHYVPPKDIEMEALDN